MKFRFGSVLFPSHSLLRKGEKIPEQATKSEIMDFYHEKYVPSCNEQNASGATGVSLENTTLECSLPLHARLFCG